MLLSRSIPLSRRQYQGPQDMQPLRVLVFLHDGLTDYVFKVSASAVISNESADLCCRSNCQPMMAAAIGAAAIVSSLVLFAMQVNIERTPHGLFRQAQRRPEASQCVRGNVPPCGGNCQPVSCCRAAASRHCCVCGVLGYCDRSWAVSLWLRARFNSGQPWAATRPGSPPNKARAVGMGEARGTSGAAALQRQTKIAAE